VHAQGKADGGDEHELAGDKRAQLAARSELVVDLGHTAHLLRQCDFGLGVDQLGSVARRSGAPSSNAGEGRVN